MHNPVFSIIVPVYNTEKYLPRVLESLCRQTFNNFEVVIVNDGSQGNCTSVAQDYSQHFSNLLCISHSTNRGLLQAWLTGACHAIGKYIHFLDADDSVISETYEILHKEMLTSNADILQFGGRQVLPDGSIQNWNFAEGWKTELKGKEIISELYEKKCNWNLWNKIFRKNLVDKALRVFNGLEIPKIEYGNDMPLFYTLCHLAYIYKAIPFYPYYYNPSSTSLSFSSFHGRWSKIIKSYEDRPRLLREISRRLNEDLQNTEKLEEWITQVFSHAFWHLQQEDKEKQLEILTALLPTSDLAYILEREDFNNADSYSLLCKSLISENYA